MGGGRARREVNGYQAARCLRCVLGTELAVKKSGFGLRAPRARGFGIQNRLTVNAGERPSAFPRSQNQAAPRPMAVGSDDMARRIAH